MTHDLRTNAQLETFVIFVTVDGRDDVATRTESILEGMCTVHERLIGLDGRTQHLRTPTKGRSMIASGCNRESIRLLDALVVVCVCVFSL